MRHPLECIFLLYVLLSGSHSLAACTNSTGTVDCDTATSSENVTGSERQNTDGLISLTAKVTLFVSLAGLLLVFIGLVAVYKYQNNLKGVVQRKLRRRRPVTRRTTQATPYPVWEQRESNTSFMIINDLYTGSSRYRQEADIGFATENAGAATATGTATDIAADTCADAGADTAGAASRIIVARNTQIWKICAEEEREYAEIVSLKGQPAAETGVIVTRTRPRNKSRDHHYTSVS